MNVSLLIFCIIGCQLAGLIGSIFTFRSIPTWYRKIKKPRINPPNWIFGPVWTILFLLMGIAVYLILNVGVSINDSALIAFGAQLSLNMLWSGIFFFLKKPGYAFIEIILLWCFILFTILLFLPLSPLAGCLLIPYLLWVSFALILNFRIWKLNKQK